MIKYNNKSRVHTYRLLTAELRYCRSQTDQLLWWGIKLDSCPSNEWLITYNRGLEIKGKDWYKCLSLSLNVLYNRFIAFKVKPKRNKIIEYMLRKMNGKRRYLRLSNLIYNFGYSRFHFVKDIEKSLKRYD